MLQMVEMVASAAPAGRGHPNGEVIIKRRWFMITAVLCFATCVIALPSFIIFRLLFAMLAGEFGYTWEVIIIGLTLLFVVAAGCLVPPYIAITRFIRRNRPFLVVDEDGITIPDKGNRLVRWKEISNVGMTYGGRVTYLELELTPEAQKLLTPTDRFLTWGFSTGIIVATSAHGMDLAENPFPTVKSYFDHFSSAARA